MEPLGNKPFEGRDDSPKLPKKTPQEQKTERVQKQARREAEDRGTSPRKTAKDLRGKPIGAPERAAAPSGKGIEDLPLDIKRVLAAKLLRPDQLALRLQSKQLNRATVLEILKEEMAPLYQLLGHIETQTGVSFPRLKLSGSLATLHQEFIAYRDDLFIPELIKLLATMDEKKFEALINYKGELPRGFENIIALASAYHNVLGHAQGRYFFVMFAELKNYGGIKELERGVALALQHVDSIQDPAARNHVLESILHWDFYILITKDVGAKAYSRYIDRHHIDLSKLCLRDPHTAIPPKVEHIAARFQQLREIIGKIANVDRRLALLQLLTGREAMIYQCAGLKEQFQEAYGRTLQIKRDLQANLGNILFPPTDYDFYRGWIDRLVDAGLFDEARAMVQELDPSQREDVLSGIANVQQSFIRTKIRNYFSQEAHPQPLSVEEWMVICDVVKELNDNSRKALSVIFLLPRIKEITDQELCAKVMQAFSTPSAPRS